MSELRNKIKTYIVENFLFGDEGGLDDTISFLDSGIVDSTGILELISFIEETFGIKVKDYELVPENLDSIINLENFITLKTGTL